MELTAINRVYFIGIGGIGMSALARYFVKRGCVVCGYDRTRTDLTIALEHEGILISYLDDDASMPVCYQEKHPDTLIVYTPAIPKNSVILNYFKDNGFDLKKRSEVLGIISKGQFCIAVAGTHGKTTTSSMIAHLLTDSGYGCTAFLGGITTNYNSNFLIGDNNVVVVEADEYDRSFLTLHPDIAIITSMDADHLDIYGTSEAIEASFVEFANKVENKNNLFITKELPLEGVQCAINEDAVYKAFNVRIEDGSYVFDVQTPSEIMKDLRFGLPGKHNLMNGLMAIAMAKTFGTDTDSIAKALASFNGIRRRFSYQIKSDKLVYIDDYAHHPTEINAVHQAVRELYPNRKVLAIFQPHLFSRTRDFADGFAESLSQFDEVFLMDIYPARELPMDGITSEWLLGKMTNSNKSIVAKNDLLAQIKASDAPIIVTIGAGDIGEMVPSIKKMLNENI